MGHQVQSFLIPPTELDLGWVQVSGICYNSLDLGGDFFRIYKSQKIVFQLLSVMFQEKEWAAH